MKRYAAFALALSFITFALTACAGVKTEDKMIVTRDLSNGMTVKLLNDNGKLTAGKNEFLVEFTNSGGQPVDPGKVAVEINMPAMGSMMAMHGAAQLKPVSTGKYRATLNIDMNGAWVMTVSVQGPAGEVKSNFNINAQ